MFKEGTRRIHKVIYRYCSIKKYNSELINAMNMVSDALAKLSKSYIHIGEIYGVTESPELFDVMDELGKAFQKSRKFCSSINSLIEEKFNDFMHYYVQEIDESINVLAKYKTAEDVYKNENKLLLSRKEYLYTQKKIESWNLRSNCQYTIESLFNNKKIALSEMLPKETLEIKDLCEMYGYLSNKIPKEYKRICKRSAKEFIKHFMDISKTKCDLIKNVILK